MNSPRCVVLVVGQVTVSTGLDDVRQLMYNLVRFILAMSFHFLTVVIVYMYFGFCCKLFAGCMIVNFLKNWKWKWILKLGEETKRSGLLEKQRQREKKRGRLIRLAFGAVLWFIPSSVDLSKKKAT